MCPGDGAAGASAGGGIAWRQAFSFSGAAPDGTSAPRPGLDPASLEVSARYARVDFAEPPLKPHPDYWYPREVQLYIWRPDPKAGLMRTVTELDWAIAEGLIADPRQAPAAAGDGAGGRRTRLPPRPIRRRMFECRGRPRGSGGPVVTI